MSYYHHGLFKRQIIALALVLVLFFAVGIFVLTQQFKADADDPNIDSVTLSTYPNFETISVYGDYVGDSNKNAGMRFEYKEKTSTTWLAGIPMTRSLNNPQFSSFYFAKPDTEYEVRLITTDTDGINGDYNTVSGITKSRNDAFNIGSGLTYYISPSGNDNNVGTDVNLPLKTINKGAEKVQAGDTVSIMAGTYRERINFSKNGTANNLITFQNYGDGEVILDGAYETLPLWEVDNPDNPDIYSIDIDWENPFYVDNLTIDGETAYRFTDLDALKTNKITDRFGQPVDPVVNTIGWAREATTTVRPPDGKVKVYLQIFQGDKNPKNHIIHLTRPLGVAFAFDATNYIKIHGLTFKNFGNAIRVTANAESFSNITIDNNQFLNNVTPISIYTDADSNKTGNNITIQNNNIIESGLYGLNWSALKGSSQESSGINFSNLNNGTVVRNNTISGYFNGIFMGSWPPKYGYDHDTDIYNNNISNGGDDGTEMDGTDATNVRLWDNKIKNFGTTLSAVPVLSGPLYFFRNTGENVGMGVKLGSARENDNEPISTGFVFIYHNTFNATNIPSTGNIGVGTYCTNPPVFKNTKFINNIFNTDSWLIFHGSCGSENVTYDYNLMSSNGNNTSPAGKIIAWDGGQEDNLKRYASTNELFLATGQAEHSVNLPPIYQDITSGDFRLASTSPGIDFGTVLLGFNTANSPWPYEGDGPDLGANERILGEGTAKNSQVGVTNNASNVVKELPATGKIYQGLNIAINVLKILLLLF